MKHLFTRLLRKRRRHAKRGVYSSVCIEGKIKHGWLVFVLDRELRQRGRYEIYLN